jgi:rare lipoprotein A (peptidoglycan hydrolase)
MRPTPKMRLDRNALPTHLRAALVTLTGAAIGLLLLVPGSPAFAGQQPASAKPAAATASQQAQHTHFHRGVASWYYDDGGSTACGFRAAYGVANRTLPCGTHVTFKRGGHRITAVVDDRGPYVAGRTWDLDERSARALGVSGVATVWAKW